MSSVAKPNNLTPMQDKAIAALLSERTIRAAADKIGMKERTLYTWLTDSTFDAAYRAARRQAVNQAIARLQQSSSQAVQTLVDLMSTASTPAAVRCTAAVKVIELALQASELEDLEQRIAALEAGVTA